MHPDTTDTLSGFPHSYTDDRGTADTADDLALALCQDDSGFCIETARPHPDQPIAVPGNFTSDGEGFYYLADATVPNAGIGLARFGVEAAFVGPDIKAGDQITFERIRFRFGGLQSGAWYRITHPYGVDEVQANGSGLINETTDVGCGAPPCDFAASDAGAIDSFLTWDTTLAPPAPTGYTGNALIEHGVTGSTLGTNFVQLDRIDGPGGLVVDTVGRTDTFLVQGKLAGAPPGPTATLAMSDNALNFFSQQVGTTSEAKSVTLANHGTAAANLSSISLAGPSAANYSLVSHCGPTLATGESCTVDVAFAPTQTGTRSATLRIVDDAIGSPHTVSLMGNGTPGTPIVAPPQPQPQSQPQPAGNTTIVQIVQPPAQQVAGVQATSPLAVSRLTLARRISLARLRGQGLRTSMNVQEGTGVVRIAIYKARNGVKTGRALFTAIRTPRSAGLLRVTLRSSRLSKLEPGLYVMEVRAGRSAASLGPARTTSFRVTAR